MHTLPVLPTIRRALPDARITWLVRKEFAPLLECVRELDSLILFDRKLLGGWYYKPKAFAALQNLRAQLKDKERPFDLVLDFQGLLRTALFAKMTGCNCRVGLATAREGAGMFYTHRVALPQGRPHVLDAYFEMLKTVGVNETVYDHPISLPDASTQRVKDLLDQHALADKKFLALVPSSAHESKCWPAANFAKIAEQIHGQYGFPVIAVGTDKDRSIIAEIQRHCQVPIIDLAGQTNIPELMALLKEATLVLSNDTGPGHIADAMETPTVIIFGPSNPIRVGPYHHPERIAAVDFDKRPPGAKCLNPDYRIERVGVEMVLDKLKRQLEA